MNLRLSLAAFLVFVGSASAAKKHKWTFEADMNGKCIREDAYDKSKTGKPLEIVGARVVFVHKEDGIEKGKIALTIPAKADKTILINDKVRIEQDFDVSDSYHVGVLNDVTGDGKKFATQFYLYIDDHEHNKAMNFGADPKMYPRSSYHTHSATDNPYFNSPVRFKTLKVTIDKKAALTYANPNADCTKESTSNWLVQPGIYRLDMCGNDRGCGGSQTDKDAYKWTKMYYDPYNGYVDLPVNK